MKKIAALVLVFMLFMSPVLAIPTHAQWLVSDVPVEVNTSIIAGNAITNTSKELGWDSLAWMIVNLIMERIAASTVNWINSGFKGSPAFVTDPESYFQNIGDQIAGQYIFKNPNLNFLCGPISAKIKLALAKNYIREPYWQCTLTQVGKNMENFMDDFSNGGWDNFFQVSQTTQNNPLGAYMQAQNQLSMQISTRQGTKRKQLDWGQGFMSFQKCTAYADETTAKENGGEPICVAEETATPGSVIQNQLGKVLGSGGDKLAAADEINEIVSALLNQLVNKVVGGIGAGLRSLSKPDSTNKNRTFTDLLNQSTSANTVDYFGKGQDTSILDIPPAVSPNCTNNPSAPECRTKVDCNTTPTAPECTNTGTGSTGSKDIKLPTPPTTPPPTSGGAASSGI